MANPTWRIFDLVDFRKISYLVVFSIIGYDSAITLIFNITGPIAIWRSKYSSLELIKFLLPESYTMNLIWRVKQFVLLDSLDI